MRRKAAFLALALVGLSGCSPVSRYVARQYYPAQPRYVIFFSPWSSALDQNGLAAVATAASAVLKDPVSTVHVVGYTSTVGMDEATRQLAEARAEAVRNQIIADGVEESRVTSLARGATPYQFDPEEARRVEIDIVHAGF
ncbi:MAG: OmpA family protein [Proteobacteria bacterium]|nr:OmpA family protein [Pseudomonadota bacterium]